MATTIGLTVAVWVVLIVIGCVGYRRLVRLREAADNAERARRLRSQAAADYRKQYTVHQEDPRR